MICAALLMLLGEWACSAEVPNQRPKSPVLTAGTAIQVKAEFKVFDGTLYLHKPDFSSYGVRPLHIAYEPRLFSDSSRTTRPPDAMPVDELVRVQADAARASHSEYLVIDIESWSVYKSTQYPQQVAENISRYMRTVEQARRIAPQLKIGLFGPLPVHSGYDRLIAPKDSPADVEMLRDNNNLFPLAAVVDAIFPIGYTLTDNREEWRYALKKSVDEANRLNPRVPIYVFLWSRYADYAPVPDALRSRWIDREYWRYQLAAAYELADGIVLWGGWDPEHNRPQQWDPAAAWWEETASFLRDRKLSGISK
jgi:hypothetical protein